MEKVLWGLLLGVSLMSGIGEEASQTNTFRVMSFNIHHGQGTDGKVDLERIAALIKAEKADIVALQEVDRGTRRTARRDLSGELAKLTGMNVHFEKNIDYQGGEYGNAVLTRFPILEQTNRHYQMLRERERRGLMKVVLEVEGRKLLFLNTHLDYRDDETERLMNVKEIKIACNPHPNLPVILCGDFNKVPGSSTYQALAAFLTDTWNKVGKGDGFTFSSASPFKRIDYLWTARGVHATRAWVPKTNASDHLPVVGEFSLE